MNPEGVHSERMENLEEWHRMLRIRLFSPWVYDDAPEPIQQRLYREAVSSILYYAGLHRDSP